MQGFPRDSRLTTPVEYGDVFKSDAKKAYAHFGVCVLKNTLGRARLGLAIGKKYVNRANQRNRIKRVIRESFRLADISPMDIVIVAKQGLNRKTNVELRKELAELWKSLEIYYRRV